VFDKLATAPSVAVYTIVAKPEMKLKVPFNQQEEAPEQFKDEDIPKVPQLINRCKKLL